MTNFLYGFIFIITIYSPWKSWRRVCSCQESNPHSNKESTSTSMSHYLHHLLLLLTNFSLAFFGFRINRKQLRTSGTSFWYTRTWECSERWLMHSTSTFLGYLMSFTFSCYYQLNTIFGSLSIHFLLRWNQQQSTVHWRKRNGPKWENPSLQGFVIPPCHPR